MAAQYSVEVRNAKLDSIETTIGASPVLTIWSGAAPANCATANSGTKLVSISLPSDWMAAASNGSKAKSGTWEDTSADDTGDAGHFRIHDSGGNCHIQGTVTGTGGGGDMQVDNISIASGQQVTITSFVINSGNA